MKRAVLCTQSGVQYVYCQNGSLYISEICAASQNTGPVLVSKAFDFEIFGEGQGKSAFFLKTGEDTWTKMLLVKNRLMYCQGENGSFSMAQAELLGYRADEKSLYLLSQENIVRVKTENGISETIEEKIRLFQSGVYYCGQISFIAYTKYGRLWLYDIKNNNKLVLRNNAADVRDMSLCINDGKIKVLMLIQNMAGIYIELFTQNESTASIIRLKSADGCIITCENGVLNIGVCDRNRILFMRAEKSRAKFSPPTEKEALETQKVSFISDGTGFSASHVFLAQNGQPVMPGVLGPQTAGYEKETEDITERLKGRLEILERQLKEKERLITRISAQYSQKLSDNGQIIVQLKKSLEETEKKNAELISAISHLEQEKNDCEKTEK